MSPTRARGRWLLPVVAALAACAGGATGERICTLEAVAGVRVDVVDAVDASREGDGATVTAANRYHSEVLVRAPDGAFVGLYEMEGTFTVSVRKPGFRPWSREVTVDVDAAHCHVVTEQVRAELVPAAPRTSTGDPPE